MSGHLAWVEPWIRYAVLLNLQRPVARAVGTVPWAGASFVLALLLAVTVAEPGQGAAAADLLSGALAGAVLGAVVAWPGMWVAGLGREAVRVGRHNPEVATLERCTVLLALLGTCAAGGHRVLVAGLAALPGPHGLWEAAGGQAAWGRIVAWLAAGTAVGVVLSTPVVLAKAMAALARRLLAGPWPQPGGTPLGEGLQLAAALLALSAALSAYPQAFARAFAVASPG